MKCSAAAASAEEDEEEEEEEDEGGEGQTVEGLHARTTAQASEAPICGRLVSINYLDCAIRGPKGQAEKIVLSRSKLFRSDERAALLTLVPQPPPTARSVSKASTTRTRPLGSLWAPRSQIGGGE